jgi:hypothetical protein
MTSFDKSKGSLAINARLSHVNFPSVYCMFNGFKQLKDKSTGNDDYINTCNNVAHWR